MKPWLKILIGVFASIIILWIAGRLTGAFQLYQIATPANAPSLQTEQRIFTSNLKKPKAGDFVTYTSKSVDAYISEFFPDERSGAHWIHRLCAIGGDVIQMKNGVFYVNKLNNDFDKDLYHYYTIRNADMESFLIRDKVYETGHVQPLNDSISMINLTEKNISELPLGFKATRYIIQKDPENRWDAFNWYDKTLNWTADNFGPLTVPPGHGFVLGDNRHNSMDSRYMGFIPLKDIKGVKL